MTHLHRSPAAGRSAWRAPDARDVGTEAGVIAVAAAAGAIGLVGGGLDLGPRITDRLPFANPVLGGLALALVVAVPMAVTAVAGWRRSRHTGDLAVLAGGALVGWIVVQVLVIRTFSWLQPTCLLFGAVALVQGRLLRRSTRAPALGAP